jgi:hypothetical protein
VFALRSEGPVPLPAAYTRWLVFCEVIRSFVRKSHVRERKTTEGPLIVCVCSPSPTSGHIIHHSWRASAIGLRQLGVDSSNEDDLDIYKPPIMHHVFKKIAYISNTAERLEYSFTNHMRTINNSAQQDEARKFCACNFHPQATSGKPQRIHLWRFRRRRQSHSGTFSAGPLF